MENEKYFEIYKETKDGNRNEQFRNYIIKGDKLYIQRNNKVLRVIPRYELEEIMKLFYDHETAVHFGKETTYGIFAIEREETQKIFKITFICQLCFKC